MREKGTRDDAKHLWWVGSRALHTTGGMKTQYLCDDFPGIHVYGDATRASGNAGWVSSYSVETSWGVKKEFKTLREAKAFVENGGLDNENRS